MQNCIKKFIHKCDVGCWRHRWTVFNYIFSIPSDPHRHKPWPGFQRPYGARRLLLYETARGDKLMRGCVHFICLWLCHIFICRRKWAGVWMTLDVHKYQYNLVKQMPAPFTWFPNGLPKIRKPDSYHTAPVVPAQFSVFYTIYL